MDEVQKHLYVLILAGGGGTRLWPYSRENSPKQFIKLFEKKSLFEMAVARSLKITDPERIIICTSVKYQSATRRINKRIPRENILIEPMRKDTAMATGFACAHIYPRDPKAVIVNVASDHLISPQSIFTSQVKTAGKLAFENPYLVTIGIKPDFPHTGMGHIKAFKPWPSLGPGVLIGERFVEKPQLPIAKKYTASGQYFWNSNLFVFRAKFMLDQLKTHAPKVYAMIPKIINAIGTDKENSVTQLAYQMSPKISIDFAAIESLRKFICIPAKFNWTDVGDWKEVWKNLPQDQLGNVIDGPNGRGEYIGINSKNNLLFLDKQLIATVGVENMLVVDTPDAILICPKDDAQAVKKVVEILKEQKLLKYL